MEVSGNIELYDKGSAWVLPSTYNIRGTISADGTQFSPGTSNYTAVVYNKTFAPGEDFVVVAHWKHDYIGIGMVYGPNVSHLDFDGYSADGYGPYVGALNTSGFPNGYSATFFGQYHAPIQGSGGTIPASGYWFKWQRKSNVLTLQYSTISADGPWTDFSSSYTVNIQSTDRVCVLAGEAGSNGGVLTLEKKFAAIKHSGREVFNYLTDDYKFSLNLIRGFIGGGYIGGTLYNQVTKIDYSTDTWSTMAQRMNQTVKYGGWASALTNGYVYHNQRNGLLTTDRVNFPTESIQVITGRVRGGTSPSSTQHGIGFLPSYLSGYHDTVYNTLASYGTKSFQMGYGSGNWESMTFQTEAFTQLTGFLHSSVDGVGWFDKDYSWQFSSYSGAANTYRMSHTTETWSSLSTTNSPGGFGMPNGGAEKGVNSKHGKFYLAGNWSGAWCSSSTGNTVFKFENAIDTWSTNSSSQTRWNNEHSGVMGMTHGYFAGGYNCTDSQNAHTDKVNYYTDVLVQIADAPRQLSSASGMWSSY